jgi:DNA-binding CsgD family transcriptional regulator
VVAVLVGRHAERARIDGILERARRGQSGVLLLRGEPGIGKTSLLSYAASSADGMTIVRTQGVESEASIAFAGLHDVCRPLLAHLTDLPPVRSTTLRSALGLEPGEVSDRLAIGAATLALLATAAESQPVLVLVDDAQWVDEASVEALLFAARRVDADSIAFLLTVRDGEGSDLAGSGLDELAVTGLTRQDAAALFAGLDVSPIVAEQLFVVTGGNPLGLVEVPAALTRAQLVGDEPIGDPFPVNVRIERAFSAQFARLTGADRRALVIAAASSSGESAVVASAIEAAGLDPAVLEHAEDAGLLRVTRDRIEFRHPLVRSAVHQQASPSERRRAHDLLARAFSEAGDDDRSAWHSAAAAFGPNDAVARGLEQLAERSLQRGAPFAAARAFERSAELTADLTLRVRRVAAAAEAFWTAGQMRRAAELLDETIPRADEELVRARMLLLRGRIERYSGDNVRAVGLLVEAADLFEAALPELSIAALTDAFEAAFEVGDLVTCRDIAARIEHAAGPAKAEFYGALIPGVYAVADGDERTGIPFLQRAVELVDGGVQPILPIHNYWIISAPAYLGRYDRARQLAAQAIARLRRDGGIAELADALVVEAIYDFYLGNEQGARAAISEALSLAVEAHGPENGTAAYAHAIWGGFAAVQGDEEACRFHCEESIRQSDLRGNLQVRLLAERSLGLIALGLGRLDEAIERLSLARATADTHGLTRQQVALWSNLVDALVWKGRLTEAQAVAEQFPPPFIPAERALFARAWAQVASDDFDGRFTGALAAHAEGRELFEEARTRLAYGERLRRARRRQEAREQLRRSLEMFEQLHAEPWIARAKSELAATGEHFRRRDQTTTETLTPQELQVALQVAEGKSNRDAAAALFLSPKTVEFHLTRVYRKLQVRNRVELVRALTPSEERATLDPEEATAPSSG